MSKFLKSDDGLYEKPKYVAESFNTQLVLDSYCYCLWKGIQSNIYRQLKSCTLHLMVYWETENKTKICTV